MTLQIFQVDAFTDKLFGGNPACVVPITEWPPDDMLLKTAAENAVAETAFFIDRGDKIHLRWFTPEIEMDLCGHATLAAAHVLKTILKYKKDSITFTSLSGDLIVTVNGDLYTLDFPSRNPLPAALPDSIKNSFSLQPAEVFKARDFVLVYESEDEIRKLTINRSVFDELSLHPGGVIITAKGKNCDFVSRFFTSQSSILEDPVTGSAHCSLIPFWSERLGKKEMHALQLSARIGTLYCVDKGERVLISGKAVTYLKGEINTSCI
jgi:PhzF family phenazine biosynthesis protein